MLEFSVNYKSAFLCKNRIFFYSEGGRSFKDCFASYLRNWYSKLISFNGKMLNRKEKKIKLKKPFFHFLFISVNTFLFFRKNCLILFSLLTNIRYLKTLLSLEV